MSNRLQNKTVLITRSFSSSEKETGLLRSAGASVINLPAIKIVKVSPDVDESTQLSNWHLYDYLIFTSVNAVQSFIQFTDFKPVESSIEIIATGSKTKKACESNNIKVDLIPEKFSAAGILQMLKDSDLKNKSVLIPCSKITRDELKTGLTNMGALVDSIPIYNVEIPAHDDVREPLVLLESTPPDIFLFTSPSSFFNFNKIADVDDVKTYFNNKIIAAIGNTTANAIEELGIKVNIVPEKFTLKDTVEEIINYKY